MAGDTVQGDSSDSLSHATSILFYLNFRLRTADCKDQQDSGLDVRIALAAEAMYKIVHPQLAASKGNPNAIKQEIVVSIASHLN